MQEAEKVVGVQEFRLKMMYPELKLAVVVQRSGQFQVLCTNSSR